MNVPNDVEQPNDLMALPKKTAGVGVLQKRQAIEVCCCCRAEQNNKHENRKDDGILQRHSCGLTLELSGGVAVRLDELLAHCIDEHL
jgi:hypothetical protein